MKWYKLFLILLIALGSCKNDNVKNVVDIPDLDLRVDRFEVSTKNFRNFIDQTNYVTTADSMEWSGVFNTDRNEWEPIDHANWEKPDGSDAMGEDFPVSQISYWDACAFCEWKKGRLPNAGEWDLLAGNKVIPGNVWQGVFPVHDLGEDGYKTRVAPRGSFDPNAFGIHDLFGNVWEWTSSMDANGQMIIKGGSFLCDDSFCSGYFPEKYQTTPKDSGLNHLGFRCVYDR